jgi:hypothetical protein
MEILFLKFQYPDYHFHLILIAFRFLSYNIKPYSSFINQWPQAISILISNSCLPQRSANTPKTASVKHPQSRFLSRGGQVHHGGPPPCGQSVAGEAQMHAGPPSQQVAGSTRQVHCVPAWDGKHKIGVVESAAANAGQLLPVHVRHERQREEPGRVDYLRHEGVRGHW